MIDKRQKIVGAAVVIAIACMVPTNSRMLEVACAIFSIVICTHVIKWWERREGKEEVVE